MHISLTPELEELVRAKVESGRYNNASEVIREALRFVHTHEEWVYQMKLERLRSAIHTGLKELDDGTHVDALQAMQALDDSL